MNETMKAPNLAVLKVVVDKDRRRRNLADLR